MTHSTPPDRYAVFGNPIAHSKSPMIHALFAAQTGGNIEYTKQLVELGQFEQAAKKFFDEGGKGLNVTVPFKLDAFAFAEKNGLVSERAKLAGAVNTLKIDDGKIFGDNTDGVGLVRDITQNLGWEIKGKNIFILGAGGAASGVLHALLDQGSFSIVISNRTVSKAHDLAKRFEPVSIEIYTQDEDVAHPGYDLIINATSASLTGDLPTLSTHSLSPRTICYDMMYGKEETVFMRWAREHGCKHVFDGLGMLVEQAAESFYIWRGVRPQTKPVIDEVRRQL
jgi:shikimate dehydrogenase